MRIRLCVFFKIIFQNCLRSGKFPPEWEKANVVPTFKKGDKQCILPVCDKVFERLLYSNMFSFFSENDLISWADVKGGVPQGSILGPLLFLIFNNYLPNGLNSNVKVFADDTSLFSVAHNINDSANLLNSDLFKIDEWALQWKMSFNLDPTKQAQ